VLPAGAVPLMVTAWLVRLPLAGVVITGAAVTGCAYCTLTVLLAELLVLLPSWATLAARLTDTVPVPLGVTVKV
jgi:hypothetical protein